MASIPRKSYDTDILTVRRFFAYNPDTNGPIPPGTILTVTGSRGAATFIDPFQLSSFANVSTILCCGSFRQLSTANLQTSSIQFLDVATRALQTMIVSSGTLILNGSTITGSGAGNLASQELISTVAGLGTAGYLSSFSSTRLSTGVLNVGRINPSTIEFIDTLNGAFRTLVASNATLYFNGSTLNTDTIYNTSTYIYQISSLSTLFAYDSQVFVSSATNVYTNANFFSSLSFSTGQVLTSSVNFIDSATKLPQLVQVSSGILLLNGSTIMGNLTAANLISTVGGLGTASYISSSQLTSTSAGLYDSISSFTNVRDLTSTVQGLGTIGYISSSQLTSTTAGLAGTILSARLVSTVVGLGTAGYISSAQLTSTSAGLVLLPSLFSTVQGLGTAGYISSAQLTSTTAGLVLGENLLSTVAGLGSASYISSLQLTSTTAGIASKVIPSYFQSVATQFVSVPTLNSSFSNLFIPISSFSDSPSYTTSNFRIALSNNTVNFGFFQSTLSQIFVGDLFRSNAPTNADPLIAITQDIIDTYPRAADVLNIYGGTSNKRMIKIDSNFGLGLNVPRSLYANQNALSFTLHVDGAGYFTSTLHVAEAIITSTIIINNNPKGAFSNFDPPESFIRLGLIAGDAYKPFNSAWNTTSDRRIKEEIVDADTSRCYSDLKNIPLRRFRYASTFIEQAGVQDKTVLGFIAQEVSPYIPKAVTQHRLYGFDDLNTLNIDQINMAAIGALKKTIQDKETLEQTSQTLLTLNTQLMSQISDLSQQLQTLQSDYLAKVSTIEGRMEEMKNDLSMSHSIL